jgi:hypothetical protein
MTAYRFNAEIIHWRGPAPFIFAAVPGDVSAQIEAVSSRVSYGWGCIAVRAEIAGIAFATAIIPKDGRYLLPLKVAVRKRLPPIDIGDSIEVAMQFETRPASL